MTEKKGQLPFTGMELVTDLDTGTQTLRQKRTEKSVEGKVKPPAPIREWWERTGLPAFSFAAEGWRQKQSVMLAEATGQNVEFAGTQMKGEDTKESFKKAFMIAKRSGITSFDITEMIKAQSLKLEARLGIEANWLPSFVDSAINWLGEVYGLKPANIEVRKMVAHQRRLPPFS